MKEIPGKMGVGTCVGGLARIVWVNSTSRSCQVLRLHAVGYQLEAGLEDN